MKLKKIMWIAGGGLVVAVPLFMMLYRDGLILDMAGIHLDNPLSEKVTVEEKYVRVD